ncbi:MAG: SDR family oxidoreductase, partial [Myxococcota bacterium]
MADVCVVTGAGRGLGALIAERFARQGHAVLCTDIDAAGAAATASRIGGGAWSRAQDVRDPAGHREVAQEAMSRGTVRVWVNNAGVLAVGQGWGHEDAELRRLVEVNVLGVMFGSSAAVEAMGTSGGTLVNVGSISSVVPAPGLAVYGATKHAVLGYSTNLAGDLRRAGVPVQVCCVCPDAM